MKNLSIPNRIEIIRLIAAGGMGAVYKARLVGAAGFEKIVAIKTLLPCFTNDKQVVNNFVSEAKLVANLIHENIVQIYQLAKNKKDYYFMLEFVDGISVHQLVDFLRKVNQTMPVKIAVFIASKVARGLAYAHIHRDQYGKPLGVVHCDICPRNILITTEGVPKITDFGIANVADAVKHEHRIFGKLGYVSPEQVSEEPLDFRSDIYSLGMVLFIMLSGVNPREPDKCGNLPQLIKKIQKNELNWELLPKDTPMKLRNILHKMLGGTPMERYGDTTLLVADLEDFIYKDGAGPTATVLAEYLRSTIPGSLENLNIQNSDHDSYNYNYNDNDKTMVIKNEFL